MSRSLSKQREIQSWSDGKIYNDLLEELGVGQKNRPHIFVRKVVSGRHLRQPVTRRRKGVDLSLADIIAAYSAAEFAASFEVRLDTHVTIAFGRMGFGTGSEAWAGLRRYLHNYAAWAGERSIVPAWIAVIECSDRFGHHAHVAQHIPSEFRRAFRNWAKGAGRLLAGSELPGAIWVRADAKDSDFTHWVIFSYLMKGHDQSAVLRTARNTADGQPIYLRDILPYSYADPGPVDLPRRLSISNSLGPKRRALGAPPGREQLLPKEPNLRHLFTDLTTLSFEERMSAFTPKAVATPFRSKLEDGIFDVRELYPASLYEYVTKLPVLGVPEIEPVASTCEPEFSLTEQLAALDI